VSDPSAIGARTANTAWPRVRLGDVCRVVGGSTPKTRVEVYWGGDIVWVTPSDLGRLESDHIANCDRRITQPGYNSCGAEIVPPGSVVMSSRAPIGHLAIADVPLCTNQGCKTFVPGPDVDSEFLFYHLKQAVPELQALGSGATFAEVSKTRCEAFEIALPPLPEQKRIAAALREQLDAAVRMRAAASRMTSALSALYESRLRDILSSIVDSGCPCVCLGDVIAARNDIIHPRDNPFGRDDFVGLEHIESGTGRRLGSEEIDKAALTGRKARFRTGDIVYGYLRPYLNKVWLADFDGLCSVDQYVYVVDQRQADAEYIAWFMRSPLFLSRAPVDSGPGQLPRIRLDEIARVELDLPPLPEQKRIAAVLREQLDAAARLRAAADNQAAEIGRVPAALLRRAFSGGL